MSAGRAAVRGATSDAAPRSAAKRKATPAGANPLWRSLVLRPSTATQTSGNERAGNDTAGQEADAATHAETALAAPGRPLATAVRDDFEPRFGQSFADVRVHDDAQAGAAADGLAAHAFTRGPD